jgi:hypothetical protein
VGITGACVAPAAAHDIPADVAVQVFARAEARRLSVLLRVPLAAMRDVTIPTRDGTVLLDLSNPARLDAVLRDAAQLWVIPALGVSEDGRRLDPPRLTALRVSLPSDRSFGEYRDAESHLWAPPLPAETVMPWNQAMFDLALVYDILSDRARFTIDPTFARFGMRVATVLRFVVPGHPERAFHFSGDPGVIALDPRWHQAAARFVALGFEHILGGIDHLLFLFCLIILRRDVRSLAVVVTAFTVAHSITLASAAFRYAPGALWFPPLIETLIAASIVYMALENIVLAAGAVGPTPSGRGFVRRGPGSRVRRRWMIAFVFGLVHGFGFSFALQETLQFAGSHLVTALFAFNLGVELGQLLVIALLVPLLSVLLRFVVPETIGIIIASALAAHAAWHWMIDRGATLGQYDWSLSDPAGLALLTRGMMVSIAVAGLIWLLRRRRER